MWRGGASLRYIETSNGLEISGNAGYCSGGRGFESSADSYAGEVDVNATFAIDAAFSGSMHPSLSVFPMQNSYSSGACAGRIAVMFDIYSMSSTNVYGYLNVYGESTSSYQSYVWGLQAGARYVLRLVHSLRQGTTTGYLYAVGSSQPLATVSISEAYSRSVRVGFADSNSNGWTALSAFGVNGASFFFSFSFVIRIFFC